MARTEEKALAEVKEKPEVADEKLVSEAAKHIKATLEATLTKGLIDVGTYLFEKFFDEDVERVRSRNPLKNASLNLLAEKCGTPDLPVSRSWLSSAINVAVMYKALPGSSGQSYRQLPPSHQTVLLPLREPKLVEEMAERAVKNEMPVRKLRELVQKKVVANREEGRGRPPKSVILKALDRSLKVFTLERGRKSFNKAQVTELDADEAKEARKKAEELMARLKTLLAELPRK